MKPKHQTQHEQDKKRLLVQVRLNQGQTQQALEMFGDITEVNKKAKKLLLQALTPTQQTEVKKGARAVIWEGIGEGKENGR